VTNDSSAVDRCPRIEADGNGDIDDVAEISVASGEAVSVRVRAVNLQVYTTRLAPSSADVTTRCSSVPSAGQ